MASFAFPHNSEAPPVMPTSGAMFVPSTVIKGVVVRYDDYIRQTLA